MKRLIFHDLNGEDGEMPWLNALSSAVNTVIGCYTTCAAYTEETITTIVSPSVKHLIINDLNTTNGKMPKKDSSYETTLETVKILRTSRINCIPESAFEGYTSIQSVYIEDDVAITNIGGWAFRRCTSLQLVNIPDSVSFIGPYAFQSCSSLTSIEIPNGVTYIKAGVFCGCTSLESVKIPNGVTTIGGDAFNECSSLESIVIPDSVTCIGPYAFQSCSSLTSIEIPNGVTYIKASVFCGCTSLESIKIPNGVTTIGGDAFNKCSSLESIVIPDGVKTIRAYAFRSCTSLKSIEIPSGVTAIAAYTFYGCTSLESIVIPNGVLTIMQTAFNNCSSLQLIAIPESTNFVDMITFSSCDTLKQRRTNGTNYHPVTTKWLQQRFNKLPIHQACYNASNTLSSPPNLFSALVNDNKQTLRIADDMGMTPLHILCCNPCATVELIRVVAEAAPSLLTQIDVTQRTPLQLFLNRINLQKAGQDTNMPVLGDLSEGEIGDEEVGILQDTNIPALGDLLEGESEDKEFDILRDTHMPSLDDILKSGIKGEELDILIVLDSNHEIDLSSQDESTGLFPYMSAATLPSCRLDVVYSWAMNTNLGSIIIS